MNILVLGGTGAMGRPLINFLAKEGHTVAVTSRTQHISNYDTVSYICGNGHDISFLRQLLERQCPFDAVVDFMVYHTEELRERLEILLANTKQYIFLSSSRVYADAHGPITESSARLLDTSTDSLYLKTEEYALTKARQENLLRQSGRENWTIIRPYITYNVNRLQLGVFEKESWLYRALNGRTIVFPRDIAKKKTTVTYGADVARGIAALIGNQKAYGATVHITAPEPLRWDDILGVYLDTIEAQTGRRPPVVYSPASKWLIDVKKDYEVVLYDRLYDRYFDNTRFYELCGYQPAFLPAEEGLKRCLTEFLREGDGFQRLHWKYEAYVDRMVGEHTPLKEIPTMGKKWRYLKKRYLPWERTKWMHL